MVASSHHAALLLLFWTFPLLLKSCEPWRTLRTGSCQNPDAQRMAHFDGKTSTCRSSHSWSCIAPTSSCPHFAVNPEKPLLRLRKALSPLIGIPCLPNSRASNARNKRKGYPHAPMPPPFTGVFSFFRSSHFQAARTQVQRQEISASPNSSLPA